MIRFTPPTETPDQEPVPRRRLTDIDAAKGFTILLVVFGHIVMREMPQGNDWYEYTRKAIYIFHMPFFMYLSGYILAYSGSLFVKAENFQSYITKKAKRFLIPFFFMGLVIYFGKVGASAFMHVDNNSLDALHGLTALIWNTQASPATSLWYIFVMFVYCLIMPPLVWALRGNGLALLAVAIVIYIIPFPPYVYLDKIGHNFVFLVLGCLAAQLNMQYLDVIDRWKWLSLAAFALSLLLVFVDMDWVLRMAIVGTLSLPALHGFARIPAITASKTLQFLGKYCFVIYLFNTVMIGFAKGVMFHVLSWDGINFLLFVPVLFAAGVLGPIILKIVILRRVKAIDRITN